MIMKKGHPRVGHAGFVIFLLILGNALLHINQAEFLSHRYGELTELQLSLFDTTLYAAYLITGLFWGWSMSKSGRRTPFAVSGAALSAVILFIQPWLPGFGFMLVLRFVHGAVFIAAWQSLLTLILDYSMDGNRGRNMGIFGLFMALGMGTGPVLGGVLAEWGDAVPYYTASALHAIAMLWAWISLKEASGQYEKPALKESLFLAARKPLLWIPAMVNFVDRFHMGFILFALPLFIRDVLNLSPIYRGLLLGVNALAYIILQYPIGRLSDRFGRMTFLIIGSSGYGLLLMGAGILGQWGLVPLALCFFALGICSGLSGPPNSALVGDLVAPAENPAASAFFNFAGNWGMFMGPLFAGLTIGSLGYTPAFMLAGAVELASLAVVLLGIKSLGKKRSRNQPQ